MASFETDFRRYSPLVAACLLTLVATVPVTSCQTPAGSETGDESSPQADSSKSAESNDATVPLTLVSFNDFHGRLETPDGEVPLLDGSGESVRAGGAAQLANEIDTIRSNSPNNLVLAPGDMIGASPLVSSLFHDEPTIEAMNALGLDAVAVGNHEFDEGWRELKRLADGGCHPEDGCQLGDIYPDGTYDGADFPFLAANVIGPDSDPIFKPYIIREFDGIEVAVIGLTLEGTPSLVVPSGVDDLTFRDEAETINHYVDKLQSERGIEAFVVAIHQGGIPESDLSDLSGCPGIKGPIVDIIERTDRAADIFLTGHTHQTYICEIDGRLASSAHSYGRLVTRVDVTLDRESQDITDWRAANRIVHADQSSHPEIQSMVESTADKASSVADQPVGHVAESLTADADESGEIELGKIIADAQLQATTSMGADVALMNPGGIRAHLRGGKDGAVTYADLYEVQPFNNTLITITLTGEQIHTLLENQWQDRERPTILQPSSGLQYTWHADRPDGDRVDPEDVMVQGEPLDPDAEYRVTVNNYLAEGGDGFEILKEGTNRALGPLDLEALSGYFNEHSPVEPVDEDRIRRQSP